MATALRLEPYDREQHYLLLSTWWRGRDCEPLPADVLPATGAVVTRNGQPIAMCHCQFAERSKLAVLGFVATAPGLPRPLAVEAVNLAVRGAVDFAKQFGCTAFLFISGTPSLDRVLTDGLGFQRAEPHEFYIMLTDETLSADMLGGIPKG